MHKKMETAEYRYWDRLRGAAKKISYGFIRNMKGF